MSSNISYYDFVYLPKKFRNLNTDRGVVIEDPTFVQLRDREFASADFHRIITPKGIIIAAKSHLHQGGAGRYIFSEQTTQEGERYLCLEEILPTHKYDESAACQKGVVDRKVRREALGDGITFQQEQAQASTSKSDQEDAAFPTYFKNGEKFVVYNDEQLKALATEFPFILSGPPGAGKTSVAVTIAQELYRRLVNDTSRVEPDEIVVLVPHSPRLANIIRKDIEGFMRACGSGEPPVTLRCLTYKEFVLQESQGEIEQEQLVGFYDFANWAKECNALSQAKFKLGDNNDPVRRLRGEIYNEFKVISQFFHFDDGEQQYLDLSSRDSLFKKGDGRRKAVFEAYRVYQEHLKQKNNVDLHFYRLSKREGKSKSYVLKDESQKSSPVQVENVVNVFGRERIGFCMDDMQNVDPGVRPRHLLCSHFKDANHKLKINQPKLVSTWRNPQPIVDWLNRLAMLSVEFAGGNTDGKHGWVHMSSARENIAEDVAALQNVTPENRDEFVSLVRKNPESFIVIVNHESQLGEAKELFATQQVFLAAELGGLEFPNVVLYEPFASSEFKSIGEYCSENPEGDANKAAAGLKNKESDNYLLAMHLRRAFVGASRVTEKLYVWSSNQGVRHEQMILDRLKSSQPELKGKSKTTVEAALVAPKAGFSLTDQAKMNALSFLGAIDEANQERMLLAAKGALKQRSVGLAEFEGFCQASAGELPPEIMTLFKERFEEKSKSKSKKKSKKKMAAKNEVVDSASLTPKDKDVAELVAWIKAPNYEEQSSMRTMMLEQQYRNDDINDIERFFNGVGGEFVGSDVDILTSCFNQYLSREYEHKVLIKIVGYFLVAYMVNVAPKQEDVPKIALTLYRYFSLSFAYPMHAERFYGLLSNLSSALVGHQFFNNICEYQIKGENVKDLLVRKVEYDRSWIFVTDKLDIHLDDTNQSGLYQPDEYYLKEIGGAGIDADRINDVILYLRQRRNFSGELLAKNFHEDLARLVSSREKLMPLFFSEQSNGEFIPIGLRRLCDQAEKIEQPELLQAVVVSMIDFIQQFITLEAHRDIAVAALTDRDGHGHTVLARILMLPIYRTDSFSELIREKFKQLCDVLGWLEAALGLGSDEYKKAVFNYKTNDSIGSSLFAIAVTACQLDTDNDKNIYLPLVNILHRQAIEMGLNDWNDFNEFKQGAYISGKYRRQFLVHKLDWIRAALFRNDESLNDRRRDLLPRVINDFGLSEECRGLFYNLTGMLLNSFVDVADERKTQIESALESMRKGNSFLTLSAAELYGQCKVASRLPDNSPYPYKIFEVIVAEIRNNMMRVGHKLFAFSSKSDGLLNVLLKIPLRQVRELKYDASAFIDLLKWLNNSFDSESMQPTFRSCYQLVLDKLSKLTDEPEIFQFYYKIYVELHELSATNDTLKTFNVSDGTQPWPRLIAENRFKAMMFPGPKLMPFSKTIAPQAHGFFNNDLSNISPIRNNPSRPIGDELLNNDNHDIASKIKVNKNLP